VDDETLAKFLRKKAAQLEEISKTLGGGPARAPSIPLDDLVRLARQLRRKADQLEQSGNPPRPPPPRRARN